MTSITTDAATYILGGPPAARGGWQHVAMTYDGKEMRTGRH